MTNTTIPEGYVEGVHVMDPGTEDLLLGRELKVGMVVLLEDVALRDSFHNLDKKSDPSKFPVFKENVHHTTIERFLESSRWAKIVRIDEDSRVHGGQINFIAEYADGTLRGRHYNVGYAWYVKKVELPDEAFNINLDSFAQLVAAHTSGLQDAIPEQGDYETAQRIIDLLDYKVIAIFGAVDATKNSIVSYHLHKFDAVATAAGLEEGKVVEVVLHG